MKRFRFHWQDGSVTEQEGTCMVDAARNDGLTESDLERVVRVEAVA
jgi:hypothetical protein